MLRREMRCALRSMTTPDGSLVSTDEVSVTSVSFVAIGTDAGREVVPAVDDEEGPPPARGRGEVPHHVPELRQARGRRTAGRRRRKLEGPVDHERASFDHAARHGTPEPRVVRVIAV